MKTAWGITLAAGLLPFVWYAFVAGQQPGQPPGDREARRVEPRTAAEGPSRVERDALRMIDEGRQVFRFDTFGDEVWWGDTLKLHQALAGEKLGGVGPGVSPKTALEIGLQVDQDALPPDLAGHMQQ